MTEKVADLLGSRATRWRERVVERSMGDAIREAIERAGALISATRELMEESTEGVTVQEIADRAGMSLRLLYRYFESKDELIAATLEQYEYEIAEALDATVVAHKGPEGRARAMLLSLCDVSQTSEATRLAVHEARLMQTNSADVARYHAPVADVVHRVLDDAGADEGSAYLVMAARRAYSWSTLFESNFGLATPSQTRFVELLMQGLALGDGDREGE
ncbi:MAG: TetR/AcrR family transcriptional regulator [Acidimicrobiia bacterium]